MHKLTFILLVVGGLNWLLVGLFSADIVSLLGLGATVGRVIYVLVGLSAILEVASHKKTCKECSAPMM